MALPLPKDADCTGKVFVSKKGYELDNNQGFNLTNHEDEENFLNFSSPILGRESPMVIKKLFTKKEVSRILNDLPDYLVLRKETGEVQHRVSRISPSKKWLWVYDIFTEALQDASEEYRFNINGMKDLIQVHHYHKNACFDWHSDYHLGDMTKLSVSVLLKSPEKGGKLQFWNRDSMPESCGDAVIFPGFMLHRVSPVKKGKRISLSAWAVGPRFN